MKTSVRAMAVAAAGKHLEDGDAQSDGSSTFGTAYDGSSARLRMDPRPMQECSEAQYSSKGQIGPWRM